MGGSGTQTSNLIFGGRQSPPTQKVASTESFNGTTWTEVSNLNTGRQETTGWGTSNTSAICAGGQSPSPGYQAITEEWDGSAWTEVADLNAGSVQRTALGTTINQGFNAGGYATGLTANVEFWNGSSWTEINNLSTARSFAGGSGAAVSGLVAGGDAPPGKLSSNEVFASTAAVTTITSS